MHLIARLSALGLLALLAVSSPVRADVPASPPDSWIHDDAGLLSSGELAELALVRSKLEQQTGTRFVVLTLAEAHGESAKSIAVRTLNEWNAGRNSALLLVLLSPRELYIQPGTNLATALDETTSSAICSRVVAPKLRSGERGPALRAGLEAIAARITAAANQPPGPPIQATTAVPDPTAMNTATVESPRVSPEVLTWGAYGAGLVGLVGGFFGLRRLFARKCPECGSRMHKHSEVTYPASYTAPGEGRHHFTCPDCGRTASELYYIAQLTEPTVSSDPESPNSALSQLSALSSSSSDSSWSSSSSDSSSSSSSSSDGSGGGGSSW